MGVCGHEGGQFGDRRRDCRRGAPPQRMSAGRVSLANDFRNRLRQSCHAGRYTLSAELPAAALKWVHSEQSRPSKGECIGSAVIRGRSGSPILCKLMTS